MSWRTPVRRCPVGLPACLASRAARRELALHASAGRPVRTDWLLLGDASDAT